jgi:DNA-binding protein YbaB
MADQDMEALMQQAQGLSKQLGGMEGELGATRVEASSRGVTVTMTGFAQVESIVIGDELGRHIPATVQVQLEGALVEAVQLALQNVTAELLGKLPASLLGTISGAD